MKLSLTVSILCVALRIAAGTADRGRSSARTLASSESIAQAGSGKSEAECIAVVKDFIPEKGCNKEQAVEKGQDYCARKYSADHTYVCPHFVKFLKGAVWDVPLEKTLTSKDLCTMTEDHVHNLREGATDVPSVGKKDKLENFKVDPACKPTMTKAMSPKKGLSKEEVPNFWYQYCLNQDCSHFLQSRTRWCDTNRNPTPVHSHEVCMAMRDYAGNSLDSFDLDTLGPEDMCTLYTGFMDESLHQVQSYEFVVHKGAKDDVPEPDDPSKALLHSQLVNTAGGHHIRDNAAKPVDQGSAAGARVGIAFASMVMAFIMIQG